MRILLIAIGLAAALLPGATASAQTIVFFAEHFDGPTLDPSIWRTEVLTSGPRWCQATGDYWGPGQWVDEGVACHGLAIQSPYGSATLSGGWLHFASDNAHAYPMLYSRLPGSVQVFPATGDFSFTLRLRYDLITGLGSGLVVYRAEDTEPAGDGPPHGRPEDVVLHMGSASQGGLFIATALDGSYQQVGIAAVDPTEPHEVKMEWIDGSASIRVDGEIFYGPVATSLRPTAVLFGNHPLYWYLGGAWTAWSLDEFRVETEGTTQAADESWGAIKARFGGSTP